MHDNDEPDSHRLFVEGLEHFPLIAVDGREFSGLELSRLVAINPALIDEEMARTPQLAFELGRCVAAARRAKEITDARYRTWRDTRIFEVVSDPEAALREGLIEEVGQKLPAKTAAEAWVRTLPEYTAWHESIAHAGEAYDTLYAAWQAAGMRREAAFAYKRTGEADRPDAPLLVATMGDGGGRYAGQSGVVYDAAPAVVSMSEALQHHRPAAPPPPPPAGYAAGPPPGPPPSLSPPQVAGYPPSAGGPPPPPPFRNT